MRTNLSTAAAAKSLQSCPTLCDPVDGNLPGSPVPGILQARTLECVAISFSNGGRWKVEVKSLSRIRPSATPWTAAHHAPPSMGFSRQEYWSGVPLPSPSNWQSTANHSRSRVFIFFWMRHHRLQGWTCETTERAREYFVGVWIQGGTLLPSAVSKLVESVQEKLRICALRSDRVEQANWKGYSYTV